MHNIFFLYNTYPDFCLILRHFFLLPYLFKFSQFHITVILRLPSTFLLLFGILLGFCCSCFFFLNYLSNSDGFSIIMSSSPIICHLRLSSPPLVIFRWFSIKVMGEWRVHFLINLSFYITIHALISFLHFSFHFLIEWPNFFVMQSFVSFFYFFVILFFSWHLFLRFFRNFFIHLIYIFVYNCMFP